MLAPDYHCSIFKDIFLHVMFFKLLTDVAIGAPMEGDDGSGAVYIYHGSSRGIETQYRQVCLINSY